MSSSNLYWTNAFGKRRRFDRIGHQYLSNILWFSEVFNGYTASNNHIIRKLENELYRRYDGKRLPWKPLPIPNEISRMMEMGLIDVRGYIIFKGQRIGSIRHIKNA